MSMRKIKVLELKPHTRFHFGKSSLDRDAYLSDTDTHPHSDVLFSALVNNLASVADDQSVEEFIDAFKENKIKISSAFYCLKIDDKNEFIYFLPSPADRTSNLDIHDYDQIKKIKAVQFIDSDLLGVPVDEWEIVGGLALSKNKIDRLSLKERDQFKLFDKDFNTQVRVRAQSEDNTDKDPYAVSFIQIPNLEHLKLSVHFYFMYELNEDIYKKDFELAVNLLKYNGIGGERSSGYGSIDEVHEKDVKPDFKSIHADAVTFMSLSKLLPKNKDELLSLSAYSHSIRGGRQTATQKLKYIRMIDEGAILNNVVDGRIEDLSNDSDVPHFRNGKAFLIPYKIRSR